MAPVLVVPLDASNLDAIAPLFAACNCPCHCQFWHFAGAKNDWLARCAFTPEQNRADHEAQIRAGDPAARGVLALDPADPSIALGWMKLAPRSTLPKLRRLPVYKNLDLDPDETPRGAIYSVGCFLVHPAHRGRGVARALLAGAIAHAREWGWPVRAIEAYPRISPEPMHAEEAWMGPTSIFDACGFVAIAGDAPYPVYRKELAGDDIVNPPARRSV